MSEEKSRLKIGKMKKPKIQKQELKILRALDKELKKVWFRKWDSVLVKALKIT